ncbi:outer membrane protein assembly factor BamE [Paenirhodobacter sp. CAU 1674]|jgi:outer membrane protein assembly factor BamE (lipoprotein component of BamABCDE complex)|uniref:outer membrane protein assembly factor BamE n=1 Tax=Paenirhodobacter sp. CAU 1674 TaxID=3032596 RepID=UPI0023DABC87|nr:outer membrane protein assembly factor BamE [Paenirhodobacter sp. CAU 1674]MDF2143064.1 outer membrane protein assembly factor BamE [Paenirhodobacter sp. CAU 1674]
MVKRGYQVASGSVKRVALAMALGAALLAAGCSAVYRNHGYVPVDEDLALIEVGKSTREDVAAAVGRPSSSGLLEGAGWYYVGSSWKYYGALPPQEIDRQVVAITFTDKGVVENVERFGLENGQVVALSRRITSTSIRGVSVVGQLLGSLGRVSAGQVLDR